MRPIELSLRGYGSYREPQVVDFDQIRLACITGPNGAGKSSIFDAMSWAIFGITRAGDLDQLVTEGEPKAEVALVFEHDGERYRVARSRTRGKNTTATLERETPEGWIPHGEKGPRAIGAEIERMLGISAETYVSTVLLAQGDSGRFSEADPATRKRILSEILSLDRYTKLAKSARERASAARAVHDEEQRRIDEIDAKIADADELESSLFQTESRLMELGPLGDLAQEDLSAAERALAVADETRQRLAGLKTQIAAAEKAANDRRDQYLGELSASKARLARCEKAARQAADDLDRIVKAYEALDEATQALKALRTKAQELAASEEQVIEAGRQARDDAERATEEINRATTAIAEAEERRRGLDHDGAECFTCSQHLDQDLRERLMDAAEAEIDRLTKLKADAGKRRSAAEAERERLKGQLASIRGQKPSDDAIAAAERRVAAAEAAGAEIDKLKRAVVDTTAEVQEAAGDVATKEGLLASLAEDDVLSGLRSERDALFAVQQGEEEQKKAYALAKATLAGLAKEREELTKTAGRLNGILESYAAMRTERQDRVEKAKAAATDAAEWAQLSRAYGPDGVPNLVFSGVVDELERDASGLMEDLTNGAFRLVLRTTAQNKTDGSVRETLDVAVVTQAGERPYGALSGGERFRVDLALRVALARLLTRRSGAPIEFLALDEGWGALDPEGIAAMLDALRQLHEEFRLILTITHTPEVAAAFDARLEVERDTDGTSVVQLVAA